MAYLTGWLYRKPVTLSRASGAVTNYQMKLLVGESSGATGEDVDCGGLCKTDFSDLRFTAADGTTLLDYWIESISGTTPSQLATVWIEFDSIGTGATTFYMYYGNAGASPVSSGPNTFLIFDDFEDGSVDTGVWSEGNNAVGSGSVVEASGRIALYATGTGSTWASRWLVGDTQLTLGTGKRIRTFLQVVHSSSVNNDVSVAVKQNHVVNADSVGENMRWMLYGSSASPMTYLQSNSKGTIKSASDADLDRIVEMLIDPTNVTIKLDGSVWQAATAHGLTTSTVYLYLNGDTSAASQQVGYSNYIYVCEWAPTEPAWGSWGAQEACLNNYVLELGAGTFSLSGTAVSLKATAKIPLVPVAYSMVGQDAFFPKMLVPFALGSGAFAMAGSDLDFHKTTRMKLDPGAYIIEGKAMDPYHSWYRSAASLNYQFAKQRREF